MADFSTRPMQASDEGFVFSAWLAGFGDSDPTARVFGYRGLRPEWWLSWHRTIEQLLVLPNTRTLVAHVIGEPNQLLGFVSGAAPNILHWLYVKQAYRRLGIGTTLLRAAFPDANSGDCTFWSRHLLASAWRYNPERLQELFP